MGFGRENQTKAATRPATTRTAMDKRRASFDEVPPGRLTGGGDEAGMESGVLTGRDMLARFFRRRKRYGEPAASRIKAFLGRKCACR